MNAADIRTALLTATLTAHADYHSSANWNGSPDPSDWRNVRMVCRCGQVLPQAHRDAIVAAHHRHIAERQAAALGVAV